MTRHPDDSRHLDNAFDKGVFHANRGALFTAVRCFVDAHHHGDNRAVHYLRALRPFCDDLTFGMVALDITRNR